MASELIKVLLVGDQNLSVQGLRSFVEQEEDLKVVGETFSVENALEEAAILFPDVILMDVKRPDHNLLEAIHQIKMTGLAGEVIILSLYDGYLVQAIEAGARGYLSKETNREELVCAIRQVHQGEIVLGRGLLASPILMKAIVRRLQKVAGERVASTTQITTRTETSEPLASLPSDSQTPILVRAREAPAVTVLAAQQAGTLSEATLPRTTTAPGFLETQAIPAGIGAGRGIGVADMTHALTPRVQLPDVSDSRPAEESREHVTSRVVGKPHEFNVDAELLVPPPVDASRLLAFFGTLRDRHHAEILHTVGSWEGGTWMKIRLRSSIDLKEELAGMPEVAQAWETQLESKEFLQRTVPLPHDVGESNTSNYFIVKLASEAAQLELPMWEKET